jgi:hypothetical protein
MVIFPILSVVEEQSLLPRLEAADGEGVDIEWQL